MCIPLALPRCQRFVLSAALCRRIYVFSDPDICQHLATRAHSLPCCRWTRRMWVMAMIGPAVFGISYWLLAVERHRWRYGYYHVHQACFGLQNSDVFVRWRALDKVSNVRPFTCAHVHVEICCRRHSVESYSVHAAAVTGKQWWAGHWYTLVQFGQLSGLFPHRRGARRRRIESVNHNTAYADGSEASMEGEGCTVWRAVPSGGHGGAWHSQRCPK